MKITILGPAHPYRGGIAALNERLAEQLVHEGHQVNVVSFTLQYPSILFPGKTQMTTEPAEFTFPITQELNSVNPFSWVKTGKRIRDNRPDLLIVRFWIPFLAPALGTVCRLVKKNNHTRIIAIFDNVIPHEKRPGDRMLSRYFVLKADGFIAMSKRVLHDLSLFDTKKPRAYTPHPIYDHYGTIEPREIALKKLELDNHYRYILFFGFVRDYKGLDLLLEAFADNFFRENNIRLIVAGEFYADEAAYMDQIESLGIGDQIVLKTDYIRNCEVENYFNACDLVAQPYKSATQSGVTQIGYHFHKPMLVTDVGGLSEIIPHMIAGYVVQPNAAAIRDALIDFFKQDRLETFTQNVIEEKKRFSWENMTKTIYHLDNELKHD